jgi:hypothetical protein
VDIETKDDLLAAFEVGDADDALEVGGGVGEGGAGEGFADEGGDAVAVVDVAGVGVAGAVADGVEDAIAVDIPLGDGAVVDADADDVIVACAGLAGGVGEEFEVEVDGLSADSAVANLDGDEVGDDITAGEVAAFEGFDDVVVFADGAVIECAAAGGVVVGERRGGDEVEGEVAAGEEATIFELLECCDDGGLSGGF